LIIETPSRLHVTLIDLNGRYGRIDGGVGITTRSPCLILEATAGCEETRIEFSEKDIPIDTIEDYHKKIFSASHIINEYLNMDESYLFNVREVFPSHSGLGSGTQLSLATAKLILKMHDHDLPASKIGELVGRGGTSGIGVASFEDGGFIIDGGHKKSVKKDFLPSSASKASPPPIIARYDFPEDWKIILAIPHVERKVFGDGEVNIFQKYCPIPLGEVQELTHLLFMKMMPAVIEEDLDSFGDAVNNIQSIGFKKIELKLQNPFIKELMENLENAGSAGVGMSSFGPTVYAVTDTNTNQICRAARNSMKGMDGEIILTGAQNSGAQII
jgi:beta-ribofuranosylaminobenzene 5'-phosphate synthase